MAKFQFRMQKLLEYRQLQEKWAKDAYMEALARQAEAEAELAAIKLRAAESLRARPCALDERMTLDSYVTRLEDECRAAETTIGVLASEVDVAREEWHEARKNAEAFVKLRDTALEAWNLDENRKEQNELDEWSVFRRAA